MGNPARHRIECLDDDEMLAFVSGELAAERRGDAIAHIDECETCRDLAAVLARETSLTKKSATESTAPRSLPPPSNPFHQDVLISGRFRMLSALGRGAMGTVYRVRDETTGGDVALKMVHDAENDSRAFERELKVGRKVTHPNVCKLHDSGRHEGVAYITMELVEGETLADIVRRDEKSGVRMSVQEALTILSGVAAGLAAIHAKGIVHRDLKPANVMIERSTGKPVLTDFGFAAELEAKQSRRLVGTPSFWAPEQARGESTTPASDVYSFGVLAYRLLAGREFSLSTSNMSEVPRTYRSLVARCLEARPANRYQDGSEVAAALAQRKKPAMFAWVGVGAAAVVSLTVVLGLRAQPPPPEPAKPEPVSAGLTPPPLPASPAPAASSAPVAVPIPEPIVSAKPPDKPRPVVKPASIAKPPVAPAISTSAAAKPDNDPLYRH